MAEKATAPRFVSWWTSGPHKRRLVAVVCRSLCVFVANGLFLVLFAIERGIYTANGG